MSVRIHRLFNALPRYRWEDIDRINCQSGIYLIFEQGEVYRDMDRIVRVGTHDMDGRLRIRLKNHFVYENKDGSIFRKNIGKAMLNQAHDPYLRIWSMNSSDRGAMRIVAGYDPVYQKQVEKLVSGYMREHMSFAFFSVSTAEDRHRYEEGLIAELHHTEDFLSSPNWLGRQSPEHEIRQSGLWLKQGLNGVLLTDCEFAAIQSLCEKTY